MTGGYTLHTQTGLLKLPVCVRLLYPWLAYCAPRPKHRLSLPSSQNSSLNCALFFSRTGPASVGNQHSAPTAEFRPGQAITTHRNLAGARSPFQHQQLVCLPRSHRSSCSLAGQTCCQTKHTGRVSRCAGVCESGNTELQLRVASRSGVGEDLAWWWWIRTVQLSTEVDWGQ